MKLRYMVFTILLVSGCITTSGIYRVSGVQANGDPVNVDFTVKGSQIYSVRNAMCSQYPHATVHIKDFKTGENLDNESPYECR